MYKDSVRIYKGGAIVAQCPDPERKTLPDIGWPSKEIDCFFFSRIKLAPPVICSVIAGTALLKYLDQCQLVTEEMIYEPLRYVHGRAEMSKGQPTVSSVLLVAPKIELPMHEWLPLLPQIYELFLRLGRNA